MPAQLCASGSTWFVWPSKGAAWLVGWLVGLKGLMVWNALVGLQ